MDDNSIMKFGAHKGKHLRDVPDSYLLWLYENNKCSIDLKEYIEENLDVINKNLH